MTDLERLSRAALLARLRAAKSLIRALIALERCRVRTAVAHA